MLGLAWDVKVAKIRQEMNEEADSRTQAWSVSRRSACAMILT